MEIIYMTVTHIHGNMLKTVIWLAKNPSNTPKCAKYLQYSTKMECLSVNICTAKPLIAKQILGVNAVRQDYYYLLFGGKHLCSQS